MSTRLLSAALLGVAVGATAVTLNPLHSAPAPAPEPRPQRWEYKVVLVSGRPTPGAAGEDAMTQLTDQFNALAKDGWEYAGPVVQRITGSQHCVAFRRSKQ